MTQEDKYIKENNLDEIDAFLFKEFGILGGACSAQMTSQYYTARQVAEKLWKKKDPVSEDLEEAASDYVFKEHKSPLNMIMHQADLKAETQYINDCELCFIAGANWQKEQTIDNACEWLLNNIRYYSTNALGAEYMCNDFRKAMEEEK